jgi:hypothetical protein
MGRGPARGLSWLALAAGVIGLPAAPVGSDEIKGWGATKAADSGVDRDVKHGGSAAAWLAGRSKTGPKVKTLVQAILADEFRGKRVRFSAYTKSQDLTDWAGLWMRVDTARHSPSFDNMIERPIKRTTEWTKHHIVLLVPADAEVISFGILLVGDGRVWIDDASFEIVPDVIGTTKNFDPNVPEMPSDLRDQLRRHADELREKKAYRPTNLDFES